MSFEEIKTVDEVTVVENGTILYRECNRVLKNGEQIAQSFHRVSLVPGQDLTGQPEMVVHIASLAWTPEVIAAHEAKLAAAMAGPSAGV